MSAHFEFRKEDQEYGLVKLIRTSELPTIKFPLSLLQEGMGGVFPMKVYVMSGCPDCTQVKELAKTDARFTLIDIGESPRNLKEFLRLRDTHPAFDRVKERGTIGIPCFVQEDGSIVFALNRLNNPPVLEDATDDMPTGAACSLDGTGC